MDNRPLSLTIIGWWMVIGSLFGLYATLTMRSNALAMRMIEQMHLSVAFQQAVGAVGCVIGLACAYGLFKAQPWSRVLYVGWGIVGMVISLFTSPFKSVLIIGVVITAAIAFFLFRPVADRYFAAKWLQLQRSDA